MSSIPKMILSAARRLWVAVLALGALGASAPQAIAQTGSVSGRVVEVQTGAPVADAQVLVVGTSRGTLTSADGTYRISDLLPGEYEVQVHSIGYRAVSNTAVVTDGGDARVDFQVVETAIPLDEILISGQVTGTSRRSMGASAVTIRAPELETAPVTSVSQLLQSRAPGVLVLPGGGKTGQGSRVILRGLGSLTQTVQPLIFLDGVRIDNTTHTGVQTGGAAWSGLDDINPMDVERVEILRGPAATTLYGTEAAAGVIHVITKQGRGGEQTWSARSEFGVNSTPRDWWDVSPAAGEFYDDFVQNGRRHRQHVSVRGAIEQFNYYASTNFGSEDGVLPGSGADHASFRANMRVTPSQKVGIALSTGFTRRDIEFPYDGASPYGIGANALGGITEEERIDPESLDEIDVVLQSNRFTGGATVEHKPIRSFTHRLTTGIDIFDSDNDEFVPWGNEVYLEGRKTNDRRQARTVSGRYDASYQTRIATGVQSTTRAGVQGYTKSSALTYGQGLRFAGPGLSTVSAAASTTSSETRFTSRSLGFFLEEQVGFHDRLFVTVGARADNHSAFGEDLGYQLYPKAAVSYLISDAGFWPEQLGTVRLRGAYGTAGQEPGAYLAKRTWASVRYNGWSTGLSTGNLGNPELAAELTREVELGFDAGLLGERLNLGVTYYDQRITDALYPYRPIPSTGYTELSLQNVAEVSNSGLELTLGALVVDAPGFRWNARGTFWTNENQVEDLGGPDQEPLNVMSTQWIREGYPVASFFSEDETYLGSAFPTRSLQLASDFTLPRGVALNLLVDHTGGHHLESHTLRRLDEVAGETELDPADYVFAADTWRLREVGLAYDLGSVLPQQLRMSSAVLSLAARNLWRSQEYGGLEAEASFDASRELVNQTFFDTPLPRQFTAALSVQF